jgi:subtilisin family serine protease
MSRPARLRCLLGAIVILCLLPAGTAFSASLERMSSNLRLMLEGAPVKAPLYASRIITMEEEKEVVRVVVRAACSAEVLEQAGLRVSSRIGDVFTGTIPLQMVEKLAAVPEVIYIQTPSRLEPHLNVSVPLIKGDKVRSGATGNYTGFTGRGVIIGIIDSGLDINHLDFKNPDGTTRVLALWDQTLDGNPPDDFTFGNECTKEDIDSGVCTFRDVAGHGTQVAGIAAGNGRATGNGYAAGRYIGLAPEADLIVVNADEGGAFFSDRIIDAINYIQARAESFNRPVVINISLGSQDTPHDGTDLLERAIDAASGPGKLFVISAGNSGNNDTLDQMQPSIHAQGQLAAVGDSDDIVITIPEDQCRNTGSLNDFLDLVFWYEGQDSFLIRVTSPNGFVTEAATGQVNEESSRNTQDGYIIIDNASGGANPNNFDNEARITVMDFFDQNGDGQSLPVGGDWTVTITAQLSPTFGTYDLWIPGSQFCNRINKVGVSSTTSPANIYNTKLISSPGNSLQAITVGAFVGRNSWVNVNKTTVTRPQDTVGGIAFFSSPGPTRDARNKPDIAAPGQNIISALIGPPESNFVFPVEQIVEDGVHVISGGTSFSAPVITGLVALMLQNNVSSNPSATLQPFQVKNWLRLSATSDAFTGAVPNNLWGAGKVDVLEAMKLNPPPGPTNLTAKALRNLEIELNWSNTDPPATRFRIERKIGETGTFQPYTSVTGALTYRDTGLTEDTFYGYRVVAFFGELASQPSNEAGAVAIKKSDDGGGGCFIRTVLPW